MYAMKVNVLQIVERTLTNQYFDMWKSSSVIQSSISSISQIIVELLQDIQLA